MAIGSSLFFYISTLIYDVENVFRLKVPDTRWELLTDEHGLVMLLRDSVHNTRRFEYPWALLNIPRDAERILDAGCGGSSFTFFLSDCFKSVYGLDISTGRVAEMEKIKKYSHRFASLTPVVGDITNIGFPNGYFDCSTCISTLEHLDKNLVFTAIDELIRVTKNGGVILITTDIEIAPTPDKLCIEDLHKIARRYGFIIPEFRPHTSFQELKGDYFTVACIKMVK